LVGQRFVQPIINPGIGKAASTRLAVRARTFGVGELHHRLGTGKMVEKLLRLALKEQVLSRIANQCGAFDLLGNSVLQIERLCRGQIGARAGGAGHIHAVGAQSATVLVFIA